MAQGLRGDARIGVTVAKGEGYLWLKNTNGVYIHLKPEMEGLALTLGADAIHIELED